ncbi:MAG: T9SS type A sorting domain-containing protein [Bacteroidetes bacterium]|nr:T9SS type A sorting domain-containing protein [Bacteroidota bacterium]
MFKYLSIVLLFAYCTATNRAYGQLISTYAGNGTAVDSGDGGQAVNAAIIYPTSGAFDSRGNYYFVERLGSRVRKVSTDGTISTYAGSGTNGFGGDNGPAFNASLNSPIWLAIDKFDNIYIADMGNNRIRKVYSTTGYITTIAGNGIAASTGDAGMAINASILNPISVGVDGSGNVYILETGKIRRVLATGIIETFAGTGTSGYSGDGGLADTCRINAQSIFVGFHGDICVCDWGNNRVRKIDSTSHIISTIIGIGTPGYSGNGGPAISAAISHPTAGAVDKQGNIYIAEVGNNVIRKIDATGVVSTAGGNGSAGFSGDGGIATNAQIYSPEGLAVDFCDNVYIADKQNNRIRKITFHPTCFPENLEEVRTVNNINTYPNPAKEQLTITAGIDINEVVVVNTIGQVLIAQKNYNTNKAIVNVSSLTSGVYFIKVSDKDGNVVTKRFVKE